ncbi:M20/M25/M40 family metallo-hydrolase [Luteimonas vadosa]|uniref:M20/M25/M40 family metallo-hydrolase n=1 Tax=Luteimonas vadosa TaxID=1165507 RepID=A0ABP9DSN0_9GAMM
MKHRFVLAMGLLALSGGVLAEPAAQVQSEARQMLGALVGYRTVAGQGNVPAMARYLAGEFRKAGFSPEDIELVPSGETVGLLVRYRGAPGSKEAPIAFLAHMDVVDADPSEWTHDPWTLEEVDGRLHGRGVVDNKYGLLTLTQAFLRLRRRGFVPDRDLVLAFSGDEETGMASTRLLADRLRGAAFAVNSDAGGGYRPAGDGTPSYYIQAAEKTYATFELTARNKGGHSSAPRADNAIYQLSAALLRIAAHRFPVRWNAVSLAGLATTAGDLGDDPELAKAITDFVASPGHPASLRRMEQEEWLSRELRTTCVATMLQAGIVENALPTAARATINCRIFPGETIDDTRAALAQAAGDPALELTVVGDPVEGPMSPVPAALTVALERTLKIRLPGARVSPYMEAGATDGVAFRRAGIPTVGAGPLISTDGSDYNFHGIDESLPVSQFEQGLDHYYLFIQALAGATPEDDVE